MLVVAWLTGLDQRSYSTSGPVNTWMDDHSVGGHLYFGRLAFSSAAPQIWNHINAAIKVSLSLDSFKRHLKTHYFTSP